MFWDWYVLPGDYILRRREIDVNLVFVVLPATELVVSLAEVRCSGGELSAQRSDLHPGLADTRFLLQIGIVSFGAPHVVDQGE